MSLPPFYRGLFVVIFIVSWVASEPGLIVQHDEASRGGSDAIAVTAAAGTEPQCTDCVKPDAPATEPIQWYVDPVGGSDKHPGTRPKPFRTLTKAMSQVRPGDTLNLRGNAFYPPRTAFSFLSCAAATWRIASAFGTPWAFSASTSS